MKIIEQGRALRGYEPTTRGMIDKSEELRKSTLWLQPAHGIGSTKDMKIRIWCHGQQAQFQERTIIMDQRKWTWFKPQLREVRVDRAFDIGDNDKDIFDERRFEDVEYCVLAPPSRRLSQHVLQNMDNERLDRRLSQCMPLTLVALGILVIACLVCGCESNRCFASPLLRGWNDLRNSLECVLSDKLCKVHRMPAAWVRGLSIPDSTMKVLLLLWRVAYFLLPAGVFLAGLVLFAKYFRLWVLYVVSRTYAQEEETDGRHLRSQHASRDRLNAISTCLRKAQIQKFVSFDSLRAVAGSHRDFMSTSLRSPSSQPMSPLSSNATYDHPYSYGKSGPFSPASHAGMHTSLHSTPGGASITSLAASPASWRASASPHLVHRPGRGGGLVATPSTPGARGVDLSMSMAVSSPQMGMAHLTSLPGTLRHSPHTHGFGATVRFDSEPTVYKFSNSDSTLDSCLRTPDLSLKPGATPILPEERTSSFEKFCSARRARVNDSAADLKRKHNGRGLNTCVSSLTATGLGSRAAADQSRSPMGVSRGPSGSQGIGLGRMLAGSHADRWWFEYADGGTEYCMQILSELEARGSLFGGAASMGFRTHQTRHGGEHAAALLEQTARGVRRWIGAQVVRHVLALMDQVERDAASGLHNATTPTATGAATAPLATGGFGAPAFGASTFGGAAGGVAFGATTFGAPANPQQQQQQQQQAIAAAAQAKEQEEEDMKRASALDRQNQLQMYVNLHTLLPDGVAESKRDAKRNAKSYIKQRIKELGADPDLLGYVWDGGSSQEYVFAVGSAADSSRVAGDSALSHVGGRGRGDMAHWPGSPLPTDAQLLMHLVATFLDTRLGCPVRPVPNQGPAKPLQSGAFGAPAQSGAFGAPAFGAGAGFGKPAAPGVQQAGVSVKDPAKAAAEAVNRRVKFFTAEHFVPYTLPPKDDCKQLDRSRRQGGAAGKQPEISDFKLRPLVMERCVPHGNTFRYYTVVLDRDKHSVNAFGQVDAHKVWEFQPRPGPDNLFQTLAVLAIELKVHYKGKLGALDLAHPALNLMSFVPLEAE